jgi:Tol biopolymer transport system component
MSWKTAPIALLATILCLGGLAPAAAADDRADHRSQNGLISFGRFDPSLGDFSMWVAKSNGTGQKRITDGPAYFSDWAPDASRITFDYPDETGVHIASIAPDGTNRLALTTAVGVQEAPDWSADGKWIAYDGFTSFDADPFTISIWIMRSDGSEARMLTEGSIDVEPVFSPDGSRIAFGRIVGDSPEGQLEAIYVVNSDGTGLREVVPARAGLEHPDWSHDGRSIIFNIAPENPTAPNAGAIMSVQPDGKRLHVAVPPTAELGFFKPAWSPDGRRILTGCHDKEAGLDRLCVIAGNGKVRVVIDGEAHVNFPAWGPRPKHNR